MRQILDSLPNQVKDRISLKLLARLEDKNIYPTNNEVNHFVITNAQQILDQLIRLKTQLNLKKGNEEIFFDKIARIYQLFQETLSSRKEGRNETIEISQQSLLNVKKHFDQLKICPATKEFAHQNEVLSLIDFVIDLLEIVHSLHLQIPQN